MGFIITIDEVVEAYKTVYGVDVQISDSFSSHSSSNGSNGNGVKNRIHYDPADLLFQSFKDGYYGNLALGTSLRIIVYQYNLGSALHKKMSEAYAQGMILHLQKSSL